MIESGRSKEAKRDAQLKRLEQERASLEVADIHGVCVRPGRREILSLLYCTTSYSYDKK